MLNEYYKKLYESIEKKYLKEAWSDSMPDWLKPRMNATAMYSNRKQTQRWLEDPARGYDVQQQREIMTKKGQGFSRDRADYVKPRGGRPGKNLYSSFVDAGIDLQNVKFIEGPLPTSKNDPRIQPPNIGIWNIPSTGQVYAKGLNDLEKLLYGTGTKYTDYKFENLPFKALEEISDKFCYIDGNSIVKRDYVAMWDERRQYANAVMNDPNSNERDENIFDVRKYRHGPGQRRDESGYMVIPSAQRYADALNKLHARNWAKQLSDYENRLNKVKRDLSSLLSRMNVSSRSLSIDTDDISSGLSNFKSAASYYRDILRDVERQMDIHGQDTDAFLDNVAEILSPRNYEINALNRYLQQAEEYTKNASVELDF